jgi:3-oxoacyl-[acyl-carrier protein] reductase
MNLYLHNQLFIIGGATSGLGRAIATALVNEDARVIAIARSADQLQLLQEQYPNNIETLSLDITQPTAIESILNAIGDRQLHGVVLNAGGPPAKTVLETTMDDWDAAYNNILRWKVALTKALIPFMQAHNYGRCVFVESYSVKQPVENLVLSNSLRLAVVGMVKTLSLEVAPQGITLNILAPGSHNTPAINRIYKKKSEQTGIDELTVKAAAVAQIPVQFLGEAEDFASMAVWLLSKHSRYLTGQTISVDGGAVKGTMG